MITIESYIQVHSHSTRMSRNESCLRGGGGGYACDKNEITAGATSLIVKYFPTIISNMSNITRVHRLDVVA